MILSRAQRLWLRAAALSSPTNELNVPVARDPGTGALSVGLSRGQFCCSWGAVTLHRKTKRRILNLSSCRECLPPYRAKSAQVSLCDWSAKRQTRSGDADTHSSTLSDSRAADPCRIERHWRVCKVYPQRSRGISSAANSTSRETRPGSGPAAFSRLETPRDRIARLCGACRA
ncbi:hypothetical protein BV20DRAFT_374776 [Pilatotrama ljubarskyi]|nr:hypothetical protein BV20DRAFT_374776 [Pilatotrama ljubarskyi]